MKRTFAMVSLAAAITGAGGFAANHAFASAGHRHLAASHGQLGPGASILSSMPGIRHAISQYSMPRLSGLTSLPHPTTLSSLAGRGSQQSTGSRNLSPKAVVSCNAGGGPGSYSEEVSGPNPPPFASTCITPNPPDNPPQPAPVPGIVGVVVNVTVSSSPGTIVILTAAPAPCGGVPATGGTPNPTAAPGPGTAGFTVRHLGNPHGGFTITPPTGYVFLQYNPATNTCTPVSQITSDGIYQIQPAP